MARSDGLREELQLRAQGYGWNDCPMPRADDAQVPPGATEGIRLQRRAGKRARQVFSAALAASLQDSGARTAEGMQGKLGWFHLRYTNNELQDVLDSADRYAPKIIEAPKRGDVSDANDARNPVVGTVRLTDKGEKLSAPRGASLTDLGKTGVESTVLMWRGFDGFSGIVKAAVVLLPLLGGVVAFLTAPGNSWLAVAVVVWVWWTFVLFVGWRGEQALKAAALAWPRLELYRPCRYAFETHKWRHWFFPVIESLFVLLVAGALLLWRQVLPSWSWLGWTGDDWAWVAGVGAAMLAVAGVIVNDHVIRPLRSKWKQEASEVNGWRLHGRPDLVAPDDVHEWTPQLPDVQAAGGIPQFSAAGYAPSDFAAFDEDALAPPSEEGPGGEG